MFRSLSGRFLLLTVVFVMLAEILIFVPSVARFREDFLLARLEKAQIASLAVIAADDMVEDALIEELLETSGVLNVVLVRNATRDLVLSSPIPAPIDATYDLREPTPWELIRDAIMQLWNREDRLIRVIGDPVQGAGQVIEVTLSTQNLTAAMLDYGLRILILSAVISVMTAVLLFVAVRRVLVVPIKRVVGQVQSYAAAPEDARRIIAPEASILELREAEVALQSMQTELTGALRQKERLAQLGGAVAKVSHDLRNILTTAQLFTDRVEASEDPGVKRVVPKLMNSITRAVNLCESTLAFGRAEEPPPALSRVLLAPIVEDVVDSERLSVAEHPLSFEIDIPAGLLVRADAEQLYRVLTNLMRNARQAIVTSGKEGAIRVRAAETEAAWIIEVEDTGPGLPEKAKENLFQPFQGGARKGGTGLGLVISAELIRGHGGRLELARSDPEGTAFSIVLPKEVVALDSAAE